MKGQPSSGPGNGKGSKAARRPATNKVFANRSPILDLSTRTWAQQLDFIEILKTEDGPVPSTPSGASICAFLDTRTPHSLASGRMAFIRADGQLLDKLLVRTDWRDSVIFDIDSAESGEEKAAGLVEFLRREKAIFCLSNPALGEKTRPLLSSNCFVKIDVTGRAEADLQAVLEDLRSDSARPIATAVNTRRDFDACSRLGFDLFHGGFFREASALAKTSVSPNHALLLDLSGRIARGEDIKAIEEIFKKSPDLTFGLFNLIRSAFFHASKDLTSIKQAITLLGYKDLQKWAGLMLFSISHSDPSANPLFENALTRARTMEMAAGHERRKGFSDSAYMVGIFSLVPVLFNVSMEEIAESANFGEEIRDALLKRTGRLGAMLEVAEGIEEAAYARCVPKIEETGLRLERFFEARTAALTEFSDLAGAGSGATAECGPLPLQATGSTPSSFSQPGHHVPAKTSWFGKFCGFFHHS